MPQHSSVLSRGRPWRGALRDILLSFLRRRLGPHAEAPSEGCEGPILPADPWGHGAARWWPGAWQNLSRPRGSRAQTGLDTPVQAGREKLHSTFLLYI